MDILNLSGDVLYTVNSTNLRNADLRNADLRNADLSGANLTYAYLSGANLTYAYLSGANLTYANLTNANLTNANLTNANLTNANLRNADLSGANLTYAYLSGANLSDANLSDANLTGADLTNANLRGADLTDAKGMVKLIGVEPGNFYWKRFNAGLCNNSYQFYVGRNDLPPGQLFASDARVACSFPGFHFASRSWCALHYIDRPLEAKIRIPEDAQINEPWATDGKASASSIEILRVWDTFTGEDVTEQYRR